MHLAPAGVPSFYPADAALSLATFRPSYAVARLAAVEAARGSFEAAHAAITRHCGPVIGKRQVEQAVVTTAGDIDAFYAALVPVPCTASTLMVISADAKGIVMRPGALRPATAKAAVRQGRMRTRLAAGEKPNRERTATLACVYDAEPSPRGPHDIIAPPGGRHRHGTLRSRQGRHAGPARPVAAQYHTAGSGSCRSWRRRSASRSPRSASRARPGPSCPGPPAPDAVSAGCVRTGYARASTVRQSLDTQAADQSARCAAGARSTSQIRRLRIEPSSSAGNPTYFDFSREFRADAVVAAKPERAGQRRDHRTVKHADQQPGEGTEGNSGPGRQPEGQS